jgi:perosamine synthetase
MSKVIKNNSQPPELILTAGPSISAMEIAYVNDAVTSGWNSNHGDYIKSFEAEFAELLGVKHAMTTSSCTGALHISLLALGIGVGDEVIVPDITWVATASAVAYTGATPVFADVDRETWNISVETIKGLVTSKTKAIIPVHLYGFAAPMVELLEYAEKKGISIVEDAAPAIGTEVGGRFAGTFGKFGCFRSRKKKYYVAKCSRRQQRFCGRTCFMNAFGFTSSFENILTTFYKPEDIVPIKILVDSANANCLTLSVFEKSISHSD